MFVNLGYWGLFLASFLSSTIVPMSSEVALVTLIALGLNPIWCVLIATLGNSLGGMTSYGLGYLGKWNGWKSILGHQKKRLRSFKAKFNDGDQ